MVHVAMMGLAADLVGRHTGTKLTTTQEPPNQPHTSAQILSSALLLQASHEAPGTQGSSSSAPTSSCSLSCSGALL